MARISLLLGFTVFLSSACGSSGPRAAAASAAGLATVFDSTADTVFARVSGTVPERAVRRLIEELRIAPAADDTTLFTQVFDFEVDRGGGLWVHDQPTQSIFLFDASGKLVRRVGRDGGGPGEFKANSGMVALPDSGVAVYDSRNGRLSFFAADGSFRTSWQSQSSGFSTNNMLVTDRAGAFYLRRPIADPAEGEIIGRMGLIRLLEGGAHADSLAPPELGLTRHSYVAIRKERGGVSRSGYAASHSAGAHWSWHPDGYFVLGHGGNYAITLVRPEGLPLVIRREAAPVAVSEAEREDERARILYNLRQLDPGWSWSGPPLPDVKAPLSGLFVARDGRIWAQVADSSERIPEDELEVPVDKARPVRHFRNLLAYEVFGADGRFLGRIAFPRRTSLIEAEGNLVWARGLGADDLPAVLRLRIEPPLP